VNYLDFIKEFGRLILSFIVSYLLTVGVLDNFLLALGVSLDPTMQVWITGILTFLLKSIDRWLHENAPTNTGLLQEKGLMGF